MNLEWNVWCDKLNANKIQPFNVFNHCNFRRAVLDIFNNQLCPDEFEEMIDKEAMYYFWCEAEYEVVIKGPFERKAEHKIDIYDQLKLNWDRFIDQLWGEYTKEG